MAVQMQEESGLSVRKFCEREGLGEASFFAWRRKFRAEDKEADGNEEAGRSVRLAPVKLLDEKGPAAVEVVSPSGLVLRVHDAADTENIRRVLHLVHEIA
jgi:transposase-like protein